MSRAQDLWRMLRHRDGLDTLKPHLERQYGIQIATLTPLDIGTYRVDRRDGGRWVARLFPPARPIARAHGDAEVLRLLQAHDFPSERLARPDAVSTHDGQAVLVTTLVEGAPLSRSHEQTFRALGEILGRLHTLPVGGISREGGAIHSFTIHEGTLRDEVTEAMAWLAEAEIPDGLRGAYESLVERVSSVGYGDRLPRALLHPDPVPRNFIGTPRGDIVAIDWTGAGIGPRVHALAFLLLAAVSEGRWNPNGGRVDAVLDGYQRHVRLETDEFDVLAAVMPMHILVRDIAMFCLGRMTFEEVEGGYRAISRMAATVADRARRAFHG